MLKNILKLEGAQKLSNNEQKSINGGSAPSDGGDCPRGFKQCQKWSACVRLAFVCD